jgi:hypothetical protein
VIARLLVVGLLLGHGLVHAAFLAPPPPATVGGPPWPFDLREPRVLQSLAIRSDQWRLVGIALVALTIAAFSLAALATLGVAPASLWAAGVIVGGVASLGILILFFHPWLVAGLAIDLVLLWVAIVAQWTPESLLG